MLPGRLGTSQVLDSIDPRFEPSELVGRDRHVEQHSITLTGTPRLAICQVETGRNRNENVT